MCAIFWLVIALLCGDSVLAASTNDAFARRVVLRSSLPTGTGNFSGATIEPGEPHSYRGSLWWEWTPGFDGGISITTTGIPTRPAALVFTGTWPNLTLVSGPRPSSEFIQPSTVSFYARSNVTCYIALAGHPNGMGGTVSFRTDASAYSDNFSLPVQLSSTNLVSTAFGRASTLEPGEITSSNDVVGTFWWKWNLSAAGRFLLQLTAPNPSQGSPGQSPNLALYEGASLTNLKRLAFATADPMTPSRVIVDLVPGSYSIAAEDRGYHSGAALMIRSSSPNDDFSNRIVLPSEAEVSLNFLLIAATREAAEPPTTNSSVWWEWTAPASGVFAMEVSSGAINWTPAIEVFQGTELSNLIRLLPAGVEVATRFATLRAIAGQKYVIRVTAPQYASGGVGIKIRPGAINDDFVNAVVIEGETVQTNSAPLGATFESLEPRPAGILSGGSIWWRWTPTNSGSYSIEARSADFFVPVNVYRGNELSELTPVTDYSGPEYYPANVRLEAGEPVYIQVIVAASDTEAVVLTLEPGAINDDFANALPITSFTSGSSRDATSEAGEPVGGGLGQTVWYRWQPTNTGSYEIKLESSAVLSLYSGDHLTNLTLLRRLDQTNQSSGVYVDSSQSHYIGLDATVPGGAGESFIISRGSENDNFAARTTITNFGEWVAGSTIGATREAGEPLHDPSNPPSRTTWFEWTATRTGSFYIEVWQSHSPPRFAIYHGTELTHLTLVPSDGAAQGSYPRYITFRAVEGEKYAVALFDDVPREANFIIRNGPAHDDFKSASGLLLGTTFEGVTIGATVEPGEPTNNFVAGTLWHRFTVPTNGTYVAVSSQEYRVYRGSNLTGLAPIERPNYPFPFRFVPFRATAGETIYISVAALYLSPYTVRIDPAAANDDFAHATELTNALNFQNPAWSTIEPNEPDYPTNYTASVWWRWKPASNGLYRVVVDAGHLSAYLGVYQGTNITSLTLRTSVSGSSAERLNVDLAVQAEEEFFIVLAHTPMNSTAARIAVYRPAENDDFSSPLIIGSGPVTNTFAFASSEPGEADAESETVWFSWIAPATDSYLFKLAIESNYPQFLKVYTGMELTNLATVAEVVGPRGDGFSGPSIAFRAQEGVTYRIAVGFENSSGDHTIIARVEPGHVNDDFAERAEPSGQFMAWNSTTLGATTEPGEEAIISESGAFPASIWVEWTAQGAGMYKLVTKPFDSQPMSLRVFRGEALEQLQEIGSSIGPNMTTFNAQAGEKYRIRIASDADSAGFFSLRLGPLAVNESTATAMPLEGNDVSVIGQNWTAVSLSGVTVGTLWYSWTAPANGYLAYWTSTTNFASVAVFHTRTPTFSSNVTQVIPPSGSEGAAAIPFVAVTGGMTYLFQVSSIASTNLPLNLYFNEDDVQSTLEGALLGGTELWRFQSNVFDSAPDALEALPLRNNGEAWIEFVFNRPGTFRFKSKVFREGGVFSSRTFPFSPGGTFTVSQAHDWTLRSINLTAPTNVVRLRFTTTRNLQLPPSIAWLDDFQFVPLAAPQLSVEIHPETPGSVFLSLEIEPQKIVHLDVSNNLVDWEIWTNVGPGTGATHTIHLRGLTNSPVFFRSRVYP